MAYDTFFVGVSAIIIRDNKLLLGKRKNVFGDGKWGLPAGHLEHNENMQKAVARELFEETGMTCDSYIFSNIVNNPQGDKHYFQNGFIGYGINGEPILKEPDKCERWQWFDLNNLPENIWEAHKLQIEAFLENRNFTDCKVV